jgi:hypothetical protein
VTLAQKRGGPRQLKYKVHQTIDGDSRVILDTEVTTGARHDNQPYLQQLQRVCDLYKVRILEAIADRGYGSATIICTLQQQGTKTCIPLWSGRVGKSRHLESGLIYEKKDRFHCPEGNYLTPSPTLYENDKRYVSTPSDCQTRSQTATCTARRKQKTLHQRFVLRSLDQDLFEEVQTQMRDPTFSEKMSERMWKIEGLFAEAKQNHNLSRAKYRGRCKVQIQAYLSAVAQSLNRLVCLVYYWFFMPQTIALLNTFLPPKSDSRAATFSTRSTKVNSSKGLKLEGKNDRNLPVGEKVAFALKYESFRFPNSGECRFRGPSILDSPASHLRLSLAAGLRRSDPLVCNVR